MLSKEHERPGKSTDLWIIVYITYTFCRIVALDPINDISNEVTCQGSSSDCQLSDPRTVTLVEDKLYFTSPIKVIRVADGN